MGVGAFSRVLVDVPDAEIDPAVSGAMVPLVVVDMLEVLTAPDLSAEKKAKNPTTRAIAVFIRSPRKEVFEMAN